MIPTPHCRYQDLCSGCQFLGIPYSEQQKLKREDLTKILETHGLHCKSEIGFLSAGEFFLRDRLDFTLENASLGLFGKQTREIVDLEECLQLSPALQEWLNDFRRALDPLKAIFSIASFRLRVGPQGQRGLWIDAANIDIKTLLSEADPLASLTQQSFIEIGQRRKIPVWNGVQWKLQDPQLNIWFQTQMRDREIDLYSHVASFTQPSIQANRLIAKELSKWASEIQCKSVVEFGAGIGNLSFPILGHCEQLTACEVDELSTEGFRKTLEQQGLDSKVRFMVGDFQKKGLDFSQFDLILCNPPRSGLKNFLVPLLEDSAQVPESLIYMSCFPESMAQDLARLTQKSYEIKRMIIVDQFPQTSHYEVLTLLQRK